MGRMTHYLTFPLSIPGRIPGGPLQLPVTHYFSRIHAPIQYSERLHHPHPAFYILPATNNGRSRRYHNQEPQWRVGDGTSTFSRSLSSTLTVRNRTQPCPTPRTQSSLWYVHICH